MEPQGIAFYEKGTVGKEKREPQGGQAPGEYSPPVYGLVLTYFLI